MMTPSLDEVLVAFSNARSDLLQAEMRAGNAQMAVDDLQRLVREKRALVARLRDEVFALMPREEDGE